ncbi:hypothetical protein, partial [Ideonella sp. B508-1]|uniref:hypothetical protein n=1 Tax=Ideonella sp. B508-1 TaxID=137716 RepID=UPI00058DCA0B
MGIYRIVMRAGNRLMRHLSMPLKLTVLGSMLLIPLLINVILGALQDQASIRLTRAERQGLALVMPLSQTAYEVQVHRGLTNRVLHGDAAAQAALAQSSERLKAHLGDVDQIIAHTDTFTAKDEWTSLRTALEGLSGNGTGEATAVFAA